jgi:hypothetical protein
MIAKGWATQRRIEACDDENRLRFDESEGSALDR